MNPNLLNKIQAIKALRDRAGTDGEKDAAQHKLVLLLAKHKLTEQDIPDPNFSTRQRYTPPPHPRSRPRSRQTHQASGFNAAAEQEVWDDLFRKFREATQASHPPPRQSPPRRGVRGQKNRERFEKTLGRPISTQAWTLIYFDFARSKRATNPDNPAAFARAYMESAAIEIDSRIEKAWIRRAAKSKNPEGADAGVAFADRVDLTLFT